MELMEKPDEAKRRLTNIEVPLVSIVDLGANGEPFFIVKSKEIPMSAIRDKYVSILSAISAKISDVIKRCDEEQDKEFDVAKAHSEITSIANALGEFVNKSYSDMDVEVAKSYDETPRDRVYRLMWSAVDAMDRNGEFLPADDKKAIDGIIAALQSAMMQTESESETVEKRGSKMASSRLSKLKMAYEGMSSIGKSFETLVSEMKSLIAEIESKKDEGEEPMSEETTKVAEVEKSAGSETTDATTSVVETVSTEPVTPVVPATDTTEIMKTMLAAVGEMITKALEPITTVVKELQETNKKHSEEIEKMMLARDTPRGGNPDSTKVVTKSVEEGESVFASIMPEGLRGRISRP